MGLSQAPFPLTKPLPSHQAPSLLPDAFPLIKPLPSHQAPSFSQATCLSQAPSRSPGCGEAVAQQSVLSARRRQPAPRQAARAMLFLSTS